LHKAKRIRKEANPPIKEDEHLTKGTWGILLGGVFLTSFSLLTLEITLTRLLSVVLSYHYVFLAVSLALLGLGVGGIFVHFFRPAMPSGDSRFGPLALFASLFSLAIPFSVILIIQIGYVDAIRDNMLLYCILLFIPFFFVGILLAEVFRMFPAISAWVYGADLVGAAGGSLAVVLALDTFGGISTSFFLSVLASVAALLFATKVLKSNIRGVVIAASSFLILLVLLCTNLTGLYQPDIPIGANPAKQIHEALGSSLNGKIIETRWSAFGRTDLVEFSDYPEQMHIYIDGTAGTPMYRFSGDISAPGPAVSSLKADFPGYFPFLFLGEEEKNNALIIGPGGGRDILLALMGGVGQVTAVEVNEDLVDIVVEYSWYNGGIYTELDNVDIVVDEGRSFLKRQKDKYDIIMLSLPYTDSSRSLEGYALTENFLFTTNSISDYLDHLTDKGKLAVVCRNDVEISRLLSISLATLSESGVSNATAMEQIYVVGSERYPVFVLRKTPFEPAEASLWYESISQFWWYESTTSYFPYIGQEGALNSVLVGLGSGEMGLDDFVRIIKGIGYDISPVTDDSPFFYKVEEGLPRPVSLVLWPSFVIAVLVVLVPLLFWRKRLLPKETRSEIKKGLNRSLARFVVLFSMLGLGFMLVEISLIQRFTLFLGQPVLSMAALLFSLLVGAGIGSICSGQLTSDRLIKGLTVASLFIVAILLVYTFLLPLVLEQLLGLGLTVRLLATVIILLPLGFAMGFPFPLGIRLLREMGLANYIPWMWGINGICSVLGSVMTIVIAISLGFTEALLVGTICYFLVFLVFRKRSVKRV
jgi:hypothetical protein